MPLHHRVKLTKEQFQKLNGSLDAHQYKWDEEEKMYVKTLRTIKGVAEMKRNSPKYALGTKIGRTSGIMYLTEDNTFSENKERAKVFYAGFDLPEVQIYKHKLITGVNLYEVKL